MCGGGGRRSANTALVERDVPQGAEQTALRIGGMSCGSCVATVQKALESVEGVYGTVYVLALQP